MNKYTSLKLSKWLQDNGFERESEMYWGNTIGQKDQTCWRLYTKEQKEIPDTAMEYYPAYDILNDLCVKYAKEIFGERMICGDCYNLDSECSCEYPENTGIGYSNDIHSHNTLSLLQQNKKNEAEEYIMEVSILNPKN